MSNFLDLSSGTKVGFPGNDFSKYVTVALVWFACRAPNVFDRVQVGCANVVGRCLQLTYHFLIMIEADCVKLPLIC